MACLLSDMSSSLDLTASTIISAQTPDALLVKKMEIERKELMGNMDYFYLGRNNVGLTELEWVKDGFGEILQMKGSVSVGDCTVLVFLIFFPGWMNLRLLHWLGQFQKMISGFIATVVGQVQRRKPKWQCILCPGSV